MLFKKWLVKEKQFKCKYFWSLIMWRKNFFDRFFGISGTCCQFLAGPCNFSRILHKNQCRSEWVSKPVSSASIQFLLGYTNFHRRYPLFITGKPLLEFHLMMFQVTGINLKYQT